MAGKTIFKRIIDREIPADIVYEDDTCLVFRDVSPQAPIHVLAIPKKEIAGMDTISNDDMPILTHLWTVIRDIAPKIGLIDGYRIVLNSGPHGGQEVEHLHLHILGGRYMGWPPG
ncbi:MAG: histidine triad nucleotide-binding protein [Pirellulales bacterium]|nr:histidine triad nucleotide-binding protein [Pirellulales bacterium]